jgi:(2Fe-2S) ferredoxin
VPTPAHAPDHTAVMTAALVLVGMSVREVAERDRLSALAATRGATVAFLQSGDPSLSRELDRLADAGASRVVLVGVSLGSLAPANSWVRRVAAYWWRERGGHRPEVVVATRLVQADHPLDLEEAISVTRGLTGNEAGLTSAAWEDVPAHRHQVLVCRGPRCTAAGSDRTAEQLVLGLMRHGLGDDDVLVTQTGCLFPCNQAPVLAVQPDDVWYGGMGAAEVERVVAEHLVGDTPVEDLRLPRERRGRPLG